MTADTTMSENNNKATAGEDADDIEAKKLLEQWSKELEETDEESGDDIEIEPLDYDEELEKYRRPDLDYSQDNVLDHIVLATSDLDKAMEQFEKMTGLKPVMVCSLNGLGTKSARLAFDECCFLEIVAPDPKQTTTTTPLAKKLRDVCPKDGTMVPLHYAIRHSKVLTDLKDNQLKDLNLDTDQVTMIAIDRSMPWKWDMVFLEGHNEGGLVPYYANWENSHIHAAARLPIVGFSPRVKVTAPSSSKVVHELLDDVIGIDVEDGDSTSVEFSFTSKANGEHVTFTGSDLIGISFPKGED